MEEQRVVEMLVGEPQEIVTMQGGIVVECEQDIALGGFQQHLVLLCHEWSNGCEGKCR